MDVGIIGTGRMGGAIAEKLVEAGHRVYVWNRTRDKAERIRGAVVEDKPSSLAGKTQVSIIAVSDDNAVKRVVYGENGVLSAQPAGIVAVMSTITPQLSLELAGQLGSRGVGYVEAPVMGGPSAVRQGKALGLIAGTSEKAVQSVMELYSAFCSSLEVLGEPPRAMAAKLSLNTLYFTVLEALAESLALSSRWGVEPERLRSIAGKLWLKPVFDKYYERGLNPPGQPGFTLRLALKDLHYSLHAAWEKNLGTPLLSGAVQGFLAALREGYGDMDYPSIIKWYLYGQRSGD